MTACNPWRGDVAAQIDGRRRALRLTLGALAELESAGGAPVLAARLEAGDIRAADALAVIGAGLRGAGGAESDADVGRMSLKGGGPAAAALAWTLLAAAAPAPPEDDRPQNPPISNSDRARAASDAPPEAAFDWPALMSLGLGVLRLSPDVFWSMTPREFAAVLRARFGPLPSAAPCLDLDHLAALMRAYPDADFSHTERSSNGSE